MPNPTVVIGNESQRSSLVIDGWTLGDKRIMTTHVVGDSWDQFCKDKKDMVCKAFRDVEITLPIDCSQDHQLQIKGIPATSFVIGDGSVDPESEFADSVSGAELEGMIPMR